MNLRNYLLPVLLMGVAGNVLAQTLQVPKIYKPVKKEIYHKGWIDFNKNGVKVKTMMSLEVKTVRIETKTKRILKRPICFSPAFRKAKFAR